MIPSTSNTIKTSLIVGAAAAFMLSGCSAQTEGNGSTGGIAVVALIQEPGVLSPFFSTQSGSELSKAFVVEPLFLVTADGGHEPYLADRIPTIENGGVSDDGRTVTYTLREAITWSDGEPLTADDLAFTVEVAQNPEGAALPEPEYAAITETTVIDDHTLQVTMSAPVPNYLELFKQVLPEHAFESSAISIEDPGVRMPLGTGPFIYDEWKSGAEISLVRNDNYWRDEAQPLLDGVIISIVPDSQTAINGFINGDYDTVAFFTSGNMAQLAQAQADNASINVVTPDQLGFVEWLWLNHSDGGDPTKPHPVLGDLAMREAMDAAIDRQSIIQDVLGGFGTTTGSFLYAGLGSVDREATAYSPDTARAILDEAGWVAGPDGIRNRDGVRATVKFQTISGDQVRSLYQQIIQQNFKDVGIEVIIENVPSNTLFDSRDEGGLLATGDFDLAMSRDGYYADPAVWVDTFRSSSIPSDANPSGFTYSHWTNPEFDSLADAAASAIDLETRISALAQIDDLFVAEVVAIPIYASGVGYAFSSELGDVDIDHWDGPWTTASTARWSLTN